MLHSSLGTLLPLGTGGWMATDERETASFLWEYGDRLILLDAGSGVRRLSDARAQAMLRRHETLYLFLSHYHLDHIIGLTYLDRFLTPEQTLVVCAPDSAITGFEPADALAMTVRIPLYPTPFQSLPFNKRIVALLPGDNEIDGIHVAVWRQEHSDVSIGLAFDRALVYATDTAVLSAALDYCNGVRWLLHEAYCDPADVASFRVSGKPAYVPFHSCDEDAADFALQCGAGNFIPIHFNPAYSAARIQSQCDRMSERVVDILIPTDLVPVEL